jgi:hypothetical protein
VGEPVERIHAMQGGFHRLTHRVPKLSSRPPIEAH